MALSPFLRLWWYVLRARPSGTDKVAFRLDDAPALDNNRVAQDPLHLPVGNVQILCSLLHGFLEGGC